MLAVTKTKPGRGAELKAHEIPKPKHNEVLLKVRASSICGSDLKIYCWDKWAERDLTARLPLIFGHECCGEVVETGKHVSKVRKGDFVSVESHFVCGGCYQCQNGQQHLCQNVKVLGFDAPGCYAEYLCVPEHNCWKHTKAIEPEVATLFEPLGNAVYAVSEADVAGKNVVILGCGPAGLFTLLVARAKGARKIICTEPDKQKRDIALSIGADVALDPEDPNAPDAVMAETRRVGADVVFQMVGVEPAIHFGFKVIRNGGTFIAFGLPDKPVSIDWNDELIMKGIRMQAIFGRRMFETWEQMTALVYSGKVHPEKIITHRLKMTEFQKGFETMINKNEKCAKIVMFP